MASVCSARRSGRIGKGRALRLPNRELRTDGGVNSLLTTTIMLTDYSVCFHLAGCETSEILSAAAVMDQSPVLERHPQLYFSDGDIVLATKVSSKSTSTLSSPPRYQRYRFHRPALNVSSTAEELLPIPSSSVLPPKFQQSHLNYCPHSARDLHVLRDSINPKCKEGVLGSIFNPIIDLLSKGRRRATLPNHQVLLATH